MTSLATCLLIMSAIVPHHHHANGEVCLMTEFCGHHDEEAESHHHHTADDVNGCEDCLSRSIYTPAESKEEIKSKFSVPNPYNANYHLPLLYLLADFLIYHYFDETKPRDGVFIVSYKSVDVSRTHGLRAPPFQVV